MAIVFELVVNFGQHDDAVARASGVLDEVEAIEVRGHRLPITPPFVTRLQSKLEWEGYIEFSVHPRGLGYGGPKPPLPFPVRDLTDEEVTGAGAQLYDLLRRFDGYQAAMVGWDPEGFVDLTDLRNEWMEDDGMYDLDGLVLADSVATELQVDERYEAFAPGFRWLPFTGKRTKRV